MLIVEHKSIWASSIDSPQNWTLSGSSFTLSTIINNLFSFSGNLMMTNVRIFTGADSMSPAKKIGQIVRYPILPPHILQEKDSI